MTSSESNYSRQSAALSSLLVPGSGLSHPRLFALPLLALALGAASGCDNQTEMPPTATAEAGEGDGGSGEETAGEAGDGGEASTTTNGGETAESTTTGGDPTGGDTAGAGSTGDSAGDSAGDTAGDSAGDDSKGDDAGNDDDDELPNTGWETESSDPVLNYIRISPLNVILETDLDQDVEQEFEAVGIYSDNSEVDITDDVDWRFSLNFGKFDDNVLEIDGQDELTVENGFVEARFDDKDFYAQVTFIAYDQNPKDPDFLFVLPFEDEDGEQTKSLTFETGIQKLDVFFSMDTTGSMGGEIEALQQSLVSDVIPGVKSAVDDAAFGIGSFRDYPVSPFGTDSAGDQPFALYSPITDNVSDVVDGVTVLVPAGGGDFPESNIEALYQIATGDGLMGPGPTMVAENKNGIGGVEFREGSLPVIVPITDDVSHAPGEDRCANESRAVDYNEDINMVAATREATKDALDEICGRVMTITSNEGNGGAMNEECVPRYDGEDFAEATRAKVLPVVWSENRPAGCAEGQCCTGINGAGREPDEDGMCPLVFDIASDGSGLDVSIVNGIKALVLYAPFDVGSTATGETKSVDGKTLPDGRDSLDFISEIRPDSWGDLPLDGLPDPTLTDDGFEGVTPGTSVTFEISAFNDFLPQISRPQMFRAKLSIMAEQCKRMDLDDREIIIVVPPKSIGHG